MTHPLDNPVWASLTSAHAGLARRTANATRYPADAAPFVAVDAANEESAMQLASLVDVGESVLFVGLAPPLPSSWEVEPVVLIAQMTCDARLAVNDGPEIVELSHDRIRNALIRPVTKAIRISRDIV